LDLLLDFSSPYAESSREHWSLCTRRNFCIFEQERRARIFSCQACRNSEMDFLQWVISDWFQHFDLEHLIIVFYHYVFFCTRWE
jgi:hypothetical protein